MLPPLEKHIRPESRGISGAAFEATQGDGPKVELPLGAEVLSLRGQIFYSGLVPHPP